MVLAKKAKDIQKNPSFLDLNKQTAAKKANSCNDWQIIQDNFQKDQARQARISQNKKEIKEALEKLFNDRFLMLDKIKDLQGKIFPQKYLQILNDDLGEIINKLKMLEENIERESKKLSENNLLLEEMDKFIQGIGGRIKLAPELQDKEKEYQSIIIKTKPIIDKLNKEKNQYQKKSDFIQELINSNNQKKNQLTKLAIELKKLENTQLTELDELENKKQIYPLKERIKVENLQNKKIIDDLFSRSSIIKLMGQDPKKELIKNIIMALWQTLVDKKGLDKIKNLPQRYNEMLVIADALVSGLELDEFQSSLENIKKIEDNSVRYVQIDKRGRYYEFCRILLRANIIKLMFKGHFGWSFKRIINLAYGYESAPLCLNCEQKLIEKVLQGKSLTNKEENIREKMKQEIELLLPAINLLIAYLGAEKQLGWRVFVKKESDFNDLYSKAKDSMSNILDNLGYLLKENSAIIAKDNLFGKNLAQKIKLQEGFQKAQNSALALISRYLDNSKKIKREEANRINSEVKLLDEKSLLYKKQIEALGDKIKLGDDYVEQLNQQLEKLSEELEEFKTNKLVKQKEKKDLDKKVLGVLKKKKILQELSELLLEIQAQEIKIDEKEKEITKIRKTLDYDKDKIKELQNNLQEIDNKISQLKKRLSDNS